jgi:hypothetical protein
LRRTGLFESSQRDYHVTLTGPATFSALLNALQMRFGRWPSKYVPARFRKSWERSATNSASTMTLSIGWPDTSTRRRNPLKVFAFGRGRWNRKLRDVEVLPDHASQILLGDGAAD